MEDICSPLSWAYLCQDEGIEELRHYVWYTTELESTILSAKEEITRREAEILRLNDLLSKIIKERNEAQAQCQKLMLNKLALEQELLQKQPLPPQPQQQQQQEEMQVFKQESAPLSGSYSSEDDTIAGDSNIYISSSDSDKTIVHPHLTDPIPPQSLESPLPEEVLKLAADKPLPEKGKLLQAVKEAGPLLQTLLLAGPLPQWQHPPPQLDSIEIPPVTISSPTARLVHQDSFNSNCTASLSKKRDLEFYEGHDSSTPNNKYQKIVLH
ncbi:hypothetical protein Tsubulata_016547 [Turnera subulata]|uniref:Uncharacterized protein n=1 Tax=Turnera subulata TaxID=218843 RepID=A0A9Q0FE32_9ROSI|nr:hypothetical protein Tsubulata_016547 [Turnera subulata]